MNVFKLKLNPVATKIFILFMHYSANGVWISSGYNFLILSVFFGVVSVGQIVR